MKKTITFIPVKASDCGNDGCYTKIRTFGSVVREKKQFDLNPKAVKKAA